MKWHKVNVVDITCQTVRGTTDPATLFFQRDEFIFHQREAFILTYPSPDKPKIRIAFELSGKKSISLPKSPFGSFYTEPGISREELSLFIKEMLKEKHILNQKEIRIRSYPQCYAPETWAIIDETLLENDFKPVIRETNQHLCPQEGDFIDGIHRSEKRYWNQANKRNWKFARLDPAKYLNTAYELYIKSKQPKGYPTTMTLADLSNMYSRFPERFLLYGVLEGSRLLAASTSILVNEQILYDFYHGDDLAYRAMSPVVFLLGSMYGMAKDMGVRILDLGISTDQGVVNPGLYSFKKMLGARDSEKRMYLRGREM